MLEVGSLFAGVGGFDLAAERAGMKVKWQSEWAPPDKMGRPDPQHAAKVLKRHWPDVPNLGDVNGISDPGGVDVLVGGFPCQDYSVAGRRGGLAGDRGALWWQFHRLIGELRPTWVVGENVAGLLSSRGGADFETIIRSIVECGYGVVWAILDARYFGVAQQRRRVFIVGHSGGVPRPEVLALSEGLFGHPPPRPEQRAEDGSGASGGAGDGVRESALTLTKGGSLAGIDTENLIPVRESAATLTQRGRMGDDMNLIVDTLTKRGGGAPATNLIPFAQNQRDELRVLETPGAVLSQRWGSAKNETLLAGMVGVRRLTPVECERAQGFPDGWTEGVPDTARFAQMGNAVAVPVAEWIMRRIVAAHD